MVIGLARVPLGPMESSAMDGISSPRSMPDDVGSLPTANPPPGPQPSGAVTNEQVPLSRRQAVLAEIRCIGVSVKLMVGRQLRMPPDRIDMRLRFADGTTGRVYRETEVVDRPVADPCVLFVTFRLRLVRGWGHAIFRAESLLNTPLFVGYPGFVSKLWLAHDATGAYRGVYQWDGPERAEQYARALWRVLELVSVPGSIHYIVVPGLRRDDVLATPHLLDQPARDRQDAWWRLVAAA